MASKERDNTWLQLQVCPEVWHQRDKEKVEQCKESKLTNILSIILFIQMDSRCHSKFLAYEIFWVYRE